MKRWWLLVLAALLGAQLAEAKVTVAPIFASHMVLQREMAVPVWGTADAGEKVRVSFGGQTLETTAGKDGKWMVKLAPMGANAKPQTLTVNDIVFEDVLVGEVWICSGQSNMEMPMWTDNARWRNIDGDKLCEKGANPLIRTGRVVREWASLPKTEFKSVWMALDAENGKSFSAVAFFFGQELQAKLGIPIGLIRSCWSGTRIDPWIPPCGFDSVPEVKDIADRVNAKLPGHPAYYAAVEKTSQSFATWLADFRKAAAEGRELPPPPEYPAELVSYAKSPRPYQEPTTLYNAMIHPMVPFAARGFIWYQGCSNRGEDMLYRYKMQALLNGWRKVFQNPEMRLYFVQLAPYRYSGDPEALPRMWEAQSAFEKANEPKVGMAVINDIGDYGDIHPHNKGPVGKRLADFALARDYGVKGIDPDFPRPTKFRRAGNALIVSFEHVAQWKNTGSGAIADFQVAGIDGVYKPAQVKIQGTDLVLSSPEVANPRAMRYLWHQTVTGKLFNERGLPLTGFRFSEPFDAGVLVKEIAGDGWQLAFDFDFFKGTADNQRANYDVDNSAKLTGKVKRVAYLISGVRQNGAHAWLFTTMDAFTTEASKCGVPTVDSGAVFQTKVSNVFVATNQPGIPTGTFPEGNIEFWPDNYNNTPFLKLPGAGTKYDWDDTRANPHRGYGSMQVHLFQQKTTLFAYNHFNYGYKADFGLGSNPAGHPDWTFQQNLQKDWKNVTLKVFVKME